MVEGCQAGRLGHLLQYMYEYNAESPTQGRKGFNSIVKSEDDILFLSYYYLSMVVPLFSYMQFLKNISLFLI